MRLQLTRPLVIFDIEATGANWERDRIIDLAAIRLTPDGSRQTTSFRFNPGMPIPPSSTAIHGITDDDVKDAPTFDQRLDEVEAVFHDGDLAGFNAWRFDVPLLRQEFKRAGRTFELRGRRIIDVQRIYHLKERRDLSAAVRFYLNEEHVGAHGAAADAEATLRVLDRQLEMYADLPSDVEALERFCFPTSAEAIDREGKLRWDVGGDAALAFGRFQGRKLRELAADRDGRKYLEWMLRQEFGAEVNEWVRLALEDRLPRRVEAPPAG